MSYVKVFFPPVFLLFFLPLIPPSIELYLTFVFPKFQRNHSIAISVSVAVHAAFCAVTTKLPLVGVEASGIRGSYGSAEIKDFISIKPTVTDRLIAVPLARTI